MQKNINWILCLSVILLFSCNDNDDKVSAHLPVLEKAHVSMSGSLGLYDAVTFNIEGTE